MYNIISTELFTIDVMWEVEKEISIRNHSFEHNQTNQNIYTQLTQHSGNRWAISKHSDCKWCKFISCFFPNFSKFSINFFMNIFFLILFVFFIYFLDSVSDCSEFFFPIPENFIKPKLQTYRIKYIKIDVWFEHFWIC